MFKKAVKEKLKLRLAIEGPSGSGKSYSALLIARGLVGEGGKIALIDTEKESAKLYADLTDFDHASLNEPYTPERYIALINGAEKAGYDCIIIDSMSHEWVGAGGILEIHDKMPGNSWTNWGKVNPRHEAFINAILKSPCHIIATTRSKQAYTQEADNQGKQQVKKLGMAPQQRDGLEYEFTAVLKMDISHQAEGDKDRTGLFPVGSWFLPSIETGQNLASWLDSGVDPIPSMGDVEIVDFWISEADKNSDSISSLGSWYEKNKVDISNLSENVRRQVNSYVSQLKSVLSEK